MTTKRELEKLALKAFGGNAPSVECDGANVTSTAYANGRHVSAHAPTLEEERELLAAALRGIIAWKEGKE